MNAALLFSGELAAQELGGMQAGRGITVLGHYPEYVELAESMGANYFNVSAEVWSAMSEEEQWFMNKSFLDSAIKNGDTIMLSNTQARPGSMFARELNYMKSRGFVQQGNQLVPTGNSMSPSGRGGNGRQGYDCKTKISNGPWHPCQ